MVSPLASMLNYDRDNIPESLITKIRPYIEDERFQPAKVRRQALSASFFS